ncbi:MAG TPA: phosphate ABC transporter permease subunit PstC [Natronosporangium sp.]|nr:phosphate ABC transporter permease subunit PstC [Natronosporangium sp.]
MALRDVAAAGARAGRPRPPLAAARPRRGERVIAGLLALCAAVSVAATTAIVVSLLVPTVGFFDEVSPVEFLTGTAWLPARPDPAFGVLPVVVGTLHVVVWSLLVGVPVGLLSAIWLAEYASARFRRLVKPVLELLAGIPTVAIGLFALLFLRPLAETALPFLPWSGPFSIGVAGVAVGLLTIPIVASVSDDALRAVPRSLREGGYALGAGKLAVCLRVVVPAAVSGIVASIVLAASRAVGETMVVLLAAGANPDLTIDPTRSALPMTAYIAHSATGEISTGTVRYYSIFAVGSLLFVMTLLMNAAAMRLVRRFREVYE